MTQLTPNECFRLGFLLRCAEEGCDATEIADRVKLAMFRVKAASNFIDDTVNTATGVGKPLFALGKALALFPFRTAALGVLGAGGLGMAGGYGLAKMQNENMDPAEAKRLELISAYKLQADMARRRAQQYSYSHAAPTPPRIA